MKKPQLLAAALLAWASLGTTACESGFERNDQTVNSLRILGVRDSIMTDGFDWADAEGGDTVELSALIANPGVDPTVTVQVTWLACLPIAAVSPCQDEGVLRDPTTLIPLSNDPTTTGVLLLGTGATTSFTVPADVQQLLLDPVIKRADNNPGAECAVYVEVPMVIIAQGSDGQVFTATKNLRLAPWSQTGPGATDLLALQYYYRNVNPEIDQLVIPTDTSDCAGQILTNMCLTSAECTGSTPTCTNGWCTPQAPFPDGQQNVCGHIPSTVTQPYWVCGLDGPLYDVDEEPSITWYMTAGVLTDISTTRGTAGGDSLSSRTFTGFTRPTGPFTLYGVVRDGRDGENWIAQDFQ